MGSRWFVGIIILAILSLLLSLVGPWNAKSRSAQMGASIENALANAGYDFADVNMSGNVATLSGEAGSEAEMRDAQSLAETTSCETCKNKDKLWHVVRNDITVRAAPALPLVSPYVFNAVKSDDGAVVIDGYVGNEAERQRILREADTLFAGNFTNNELKIARGAPSDGWGDVVSNSLTSLALLDRGSVSINDAQTLIRGFTTDGSIRDRVNETVAAIGNGFNGAANITVPNAEAVNVGEVRNEGLCQGLFDSLKGNNKINFAVDKAEIRGAPSYDLLNALAAAANQCSSYNIAITGHTDSDGDAEYNQWLSQARADMVVDYISETGVEISRLTGTGMGESQPIASNETPEGKAANRRIEFTVTTSE